MSTNARSHSPFAIEVADVSKQFRLTGPRAGDLRELASGMRERALKRAAPPADSGRNFWALRDVSFTVKPGQPVGIVGHNGSGKSTLLKMLTGILKPTTGRVQVAGRIGALIEVGAGFHPDLSGRENVYLNGSILGLSRREIDRKMDAIVQFANLEEFIDTPVKRYSSGMYMRLGFSVAAHTDPDVMLIDEVLAVGDTLFQRKCMRKLKEFVGQGGAVVFVSHAMSHVQELCPQCVWLDRGQVRFVGPTEQAVEQYMAVLEEREEEEFKRTRPDEWAAREAMRREQEEAEAEQARQREKAEAEQARQREAEAARLFIEQQKREQKQQERERAEAEARARFLADPLRARFTGCQLLGPDGLPTNVLPVAAPFAVEVNYCIPRPLPNPVFCLEILRDDGTNMFATNTQLHQLNTRLLPSEGRLLMEAATVPFNAGRYRIQLQLFPDYPNENFHQTLVPEDKVEEAAWFRVDGGPFGGHGCAFVPLTWKLGSVAALDCERSDLQTMATVGG